jgi:hypothetical protein
MAQTDLSPTSPSSNPNSDFLFSNELPSPPSKPFFHLHQPYRSFQVLKTNPLSFAWPGAIHLMIHPIGGTASSSSPSYHSSRISAARQKPFLPPTFRLFTGGAVPRDATKESEEGVQVAKVKYPGWEGMVGLKVEIGIAKGGGGEGEQGARERSEGKILVRRVGAGRRYEVSFQGLAQGTDYVDRLEWKGSKSALTALLHEQREEMAQNGQAVKNESSSQNGNLKLISRNHEERGVLAVWQNKTDPSVLGNLFLFEEFEEGEGGLLEEVVASCLAVVCAERLSARGWLGGLGKGKGKSNLEE